MSREPKVKEPKAPEAEKPAAPVVAAPKAEPVAKRVMLEVKTTSVASFWRVGRQFSRTATLIDPASLSDEQVRSLESVGTKILSVKLVEI